MILTLLLVPASTARRELPIPVYTVDLVAGGGPAPKPGPRKPAPQETKPAQVELPPPLEEEALDEAFLEPVVSKPPEAPGKLAPPPKEKEQAKKPPEPKVKKAPPEKPKKRVVKPKKPARPKKVVKRKRPVAPKVAAKKKVPKKKVPKKRSPKQPAKLVKKQPESPKPKPGAGRDTQLVKRLKQRRIDAAVATARERARLRREARVGQEGGAGTAGGGKGSGGSVVKGVEFLAYRNQLLSRIKDGWAWFGKRIDLEVTVGFGVGADGEIFGLKLLKASGDASYDESVVRAVRRASPLPPPPASYVRDFAEVEATFRPQDLDG